MTLYAPTSSARSQSLCVSWPPGSVCTGGDVGSPVCGEGVCVCVCVWEGVCVDGCVWGEGV